MIINNNIPALNTYRQMGTNQANAQNSMEKLASGLRINRAGDDAAGLAISEKMRAQIRGLDQASRNSQDGISMIQTAEGALQETQNILQRMRELATQASNDTNVEVDRAEIQKEMNALTSEINRIGNTTEFNTQKLLNGGKGVERTDDLAVNVTNYDNKGIVYTSDDTLDMAGVDPAKGAVSNLAVTKESVKAGTIEIGGFNVVTESTTAATAGTIGSPLTEVTESVQAGTAAINKAEHVIGANAADAFTGAVTSITNTTGSDTNKATFTVDFTEAFTGLSAGDTTSVSIGGREYSFNIGATNDASRDNLIAAIHADITANAAQYTNISAAEIVGGSGNGEIVFSGTAADAQITIGTFSTTASTDEAAVQTAIKTGGEAAVYSFEVTENFTAGDAINIGGVRLVAGDDFTVGADIAATVSNLQTAISTNSSFSGYTVEVGSPDWGSATHNITITKNDAGLDANRAGFTTGLTVDRTTAVEGEYKFQLETNFEVGSKITIGGQEFEAVAAGTGNSATTFEVGSDTNTTVANLVVAMKANTTINDNFEVAVLKDGNSPAGSITGTGLETDADTIFLKEKVASGEGMSDVISGGVSTANRTAVEGQYSFDVNENFSVGDYIEINGEKYTAVTSGATGNEFNIGSDISESIDALVSAINTNGSSDFTAVKSNSQFFDNNRVVLTEKTASGSDLTTSDIVATNVSSIAGEYSFLITENLGEGDVLKIAGEMLLAGGADASAGLDGYFDVGANAAATATNIANAINSADSNSPEALQKLKALYTVTSDGNKLTLTEKAASGENLANTADNLSIGTNEDTRTSELVEIAQSYEITTQALDAGSKVTIGDATITIAKQGTAEMVAAELKAQIEDVDNADTAALRAAYDVSVDGDKLTLTQKVAQSEEAISASFNTTDRESFSASFQIGANTGQSMTIGVADMRSQALKVSGFESGAEVEAQNGSKASYTTTTNVTNGTNNENIEFSLDISTHEKATAAISVINDAIEAVSAQRSQLGAFQNRLEHTISNLSNASENLQAAESRIRDVDMAREVMDMTKNNILAQASQAMLAQANQAPQAVLQLLG